jgi:cytochrome P450
MAMYPEVQKKARAEIEGLMTLTRLVKIADRNRLPYLGAVIKECLRWRPALPLSESVPAFAKFL